MHPQCRFARIVVLLMQVPYFAAADKHVEPISSPTEFDTLLLTETLFGDGLLIPDIFLFISRNVARHLEDDRLSFFELCASRELIQIGARYPETKTFLEVFDAIEHDGITGREPGARRVAERLHNACGSDVSFQTWMPNVGQGYRRALELNLQTDSPSQGFGWPQIWEKTSKYRDEALSRAFDAAKADEGVRRGQVYSSLGETLGLGTQPNIADVAQLYERAKHVSEDELSAVTAFCRWVNEIYHDNQARHMSALPCTHGYQQFANVILVRQLEELPKADPNDTFSHTVSIPPPSRLLQMDPEDLLDVRSQYGHQFRVDLANWRDGRLPKETLVKSLDGYAASIRRISKCADSDAGPVETTLQAFDSRYIPIGMGLAALSATTLQGPLQYVATSVSISVGLAASYRWLINHPVPVDVQLNKPRQISYPVQLGAKQH